MKKKSISISSAASKKKNKNCENTTSYHSNEIENKKFSKIPNQKHVVWCSLWTRNAIKVIIGAQRIYLIKKKKKQYEHTISNWMYEIIKINETWGIGHKYNSYLDVFRVHHNTRYPHKRV